MIICERKEVCLINYTKGKHSLGVFDDNSSSVDCLGSLEGEARKKSLNMSTRCEEILHEVKRRKE